MFCQLLHRIDPDQNMARFYRVEVLSDLFGELIVERRWGRIGGRGQCHLASYPSIVLAEAAAFGLVRSKERRGYQAVPDMTQGSQGTPRNGLRDHGRL